MRMRAPLVPSFWPRGDGAGAYDLGGVTAPPYGIGLSAALKPRFAGLHPLGFHP